MRNGKEVGTVGNVRFRTVRLDSVFVTTAFSFPAPVDSLPLHLGEKGSGQQWLPCYLTLNNL